MNESYEDEENEFKGKEKDMQRPLLLEREKQLWALEKSHVVNVI